MFVVDFLENFPNLPPKEGNNADIVKGIWTAEVEGVVIASTDVAYDLETREPITKDFPWSGPKGKDATKRLYWVDDEEPANVGKTAETPFPIRDTVGPDAPTEAGTSSQVGEREIPDPV